MTKIYNAAAEATDTIDFEKIICATRTIGQMMTKSRRVYERHAEFYQHIESSISGKQLAQSLAEYVARLYWLEWHSLEKIADKISDNSAVSVTAKNIGQMMKYLNIPTRAGNTNRIKVKKTCQKSMI